MGDIMWENEMAGTKGTSSHISEKMGDKWTKIACNFWKWVTQSGIIKWAKQKDWKKNLVIEVWASFAQT